jgi:hypothetical protein
MLRLSYYFHLLIMSYYLGHTTTIKMYLFNWKVGKASVANKNVKLLLFIDRNITILIEWCLFKPFKIYYEFFLYKLFSGLYVANFYGKKYIWFDYYNKF